MTDLEPAPPAASRPTPWTPDELFRRLTFCRSEAIDCGELFGLLNRVITLSPIEFARVYDQFRRSFRRKRGPPGVALEQDFIRKPLSLVAREFQPATVAEYPGIDLPCWIEGATRAPLIILLGQDSLRNKWYFPVLAADEPYVVIGTPYTVHSRALWDYKNNPRYWAVICYLLNQGYNLYLTDVFKFWYKGVTRAAAERDSYKSILEHEFNLVGAHRPDTIVVAFGRTVAEFLLDADWAGTNIGKARAELVPGKAIRGISMLPVLHPSRNTEPRLRDYLPANGVDPQKGVGGIGEVIVRAIAAATGREPETTAGTTPPTPAATTTPTTERTLGARKVHALCAESGMGVGDRIEFIGRVKANKGKQGIITGQRNAWGFALKFDDGTQGSATPGGIKLIKKATARELEALQEAEADK